MTKAAKNCNINSFLKAHKHNKPLIDKDAKKKYDRNFFFCTNYLKILNTCLIIGQEKPKTEKLP